MTPFLIEWWTNRFVARIRPHIKNCFLTNETLPTRLFTRLVDLMTHITYTYVTS